MIIAFRVRVCILFCLCSISTNLIPAITYVRGIGVDLYGQPTCGQLHQRTYLRGISVDLCGQPTCSKSYDSSGADTVMVCDTLPNLCLNGTHLIPDITILQGFGADLFWEPACFENYGSVGDLRGQIRQRTLESAVFLEISRDIISIVSIVLLLLRCFNSMLYHNSMNRRRTTLGSHTWSRRRIFWRHAGVSRKSFRC